MTMKQQSPEDLLQDVELKQAFDTIEKALSHVITTSEHYFYDWEPLLEAAVTSDWKFAAAEWKTLLVENMHSYEKFVNKLCARELPRPCMEQLLEFTKSAQRQVMDLDEAMIARGEVQ